MDLKTKKANPTVQRRDLIRTSLATAAAGVLGAALFPREARAADGTLTVTPRFFPTDSFTPEIDLAGKVVVITGASRGLGRATGEALHALGASVIGTSRDVSTVPSAPPYPLLDLDITDDNSAAKFMHELAKTLAGRPVSALINNAGRGTWGYVSNRTLGDKQKADYHLAQLKLATETIYHGHVRMTQLIMPFLPSSGYARLLFTVTGMQFFCGGAGTSIFDWLQTYVSAKRGLYAYANMIRQELGLLGSNIKVSTVNPMAMHTEIMEGTRPIFLEPTDASGLTGDPMRDGWLYGMREALAHGLDASFVGDAYAQLLRMENPLPNVLAGSAAEPYATQGLYNATPYQMMAENAESALVWGAG